MENKSLILELNEIKENLKYDTAGLLNEEKDLKEAYKLNLEWVINLKIEMIERYKKSIIRETLKLTEINKKIDLILTNFNQNITNKTKGLLLKLLTKRVNFENKVYYWYELIDYSIKNNIDIHIPYKTVLNNLNYIWNRDLNKFEVLKC